MAALPLRARTIDAKAHRKRLRKAVADSGLSHRDFARLVVIRNERTLARWLDGHAPIPKEVRDLVADQTRLARIVALY